MVSSKCRGIYIGIGEHKKEKNKGSLHSYDTRSYMVVFSPINKENYVIVSCRFVCLSCMCMTPCSFLFVIMNSFDYTAFNY